MTPTPFYRWLKKVIPFVFWGSCLVTVIMLLIPSHAIPSSFNFWDKAQHALTFFVLMFTGCIAYSRQSVFIGLALIAYGTGMEVMQEYFTTSRNGDKMDIVADTVGVVIGFIGFYIVYKVSHKANPDLT